MHRFIIRRSFSLGIFFASIYIAALSALFIAGILISIKLCLALILGFHSIKVVKRHVLLSSATAIMAIDAWPDGGFRIHQLNGKLFDVQLLKNSLVTRYLCILNMTTTISRKRFTIIVMPDALREHQWRQLRVQLLNAAIFAKKFRHASQ